MQSLLILTDFSDTAYRAAEYACTLARTLQPRRIILYHAYQTSVATTDLPVSSVAINRTVHLEAMEALATWSDRLRLRHPETIELVAEDTFIPDTINELCREQEVDLICMGASGKSGLDRLIMGSTAARMLTISKFPVMVVPAHAPVGKAVQTIVFTTDLKEVKTISTERLYAMLDSLNADICVLNVVTHAGEGKESALTREAIGHLRQLLDRYHPSYHYLTSNDIVETVVSFAGELGASLIIAVPREHGFFSTFFHRGVSEKLVYNSPVPLLFFP
ncbi:MAG TPA: universal stress protein [Puia sp.]|nr:universal stress protein [Puia sp.]